MAERVLLKSEQGRSEADWEHHLPRSLAAWSEMLKAGMIVAFTAEGVDTHMEGSYWLVRLNGPAYAVPESQVHASDRFEAGWLVVKAQWFELRTRRARAATNCRLRSGS